MPLIYVCDHSGGNTGGGTIDVQVITDEEIEEICASVTGFTVIGEAKLGTTMI